MTITLGKTLMPQYHHRITESETRDRITAYVRCPNCGTSPAPSLKLNDMYEYGEIVCETCTESYDIESADVLPSSSAQKFLGTGAHDNIMSSVWYHASTVRPSEFLTGSQADIWLAPCTHIGTFICASYRAQQECYNNYYMYRFQIDPTAVLDTDIHPDLSQWSYAVAMLREDKCGIIRYINRWEGVGEISLIVHPKNLRLVSVEQRQNRNVSRTS